MLLHQVNVAISERGESAMVFGNSCIPVPALPSKPSTFLPTCVTEALLLRRRNVAGMYAENPAVYIIASDRTFLEARRSSLGVKQF